DCNGPGRMRNHILWLAVLLCVCSSGLAHAQGGTIDPRDETQVEKLLIPYAFYNDYFEAAGGIAFSILGFPQRQMGLVGTVIAGSNGSVSGYLLGRDIQLPVGERLFLDFNLAVGSFEKLEIYTNGNPDFPDEDAGSNDSDKDNFIEGDGDDYFAEFIFKYLLPIGHAREEVIGTYVLDRGLLASGATGAESWNPLESGRTYIEVKPFYRRQSVDGDFIDEVQETNGFEFAVSHDNTDFPANPSRGSSKRIAITRDRGWHGSSDRWTAVEGEFSKYFSLGPSEKLRQRVIALNMWTVNALSGEPPSFAGATLGGLFRMRGFPAARFNDQAAIYYAAELRLIPEWNPLAEISFLEFLEIDWIQLVPFVEVGRVARGWNISELHSDMKWDAGFGLRLMAKRLVLRADAAASEEGFGVQMMVGHPF
ncbi:MAG: BamA/TamA family outer membrane protein, partial [Candidatus Hydrogenedentota bacterium]